MTFIAPDLASLFTRLAAYAKRKELSLRLDVPECTMSVNEDGEFIFTLYLCPPTKNQARVEYWVYPWGNQNHIIGKKGHGGTGVAFVEGLNELAERASNSFNIFR